MKFDTFPDFKTEAKNFCNAIVEIDNPYLQEIVDMGGTLLNIGNSAKSSDFWLPTNWGHLWFKIMEDRMVLECISVPTEERKKGNGTKLMEIVTEVADKTGVPVQLEVAVVETGGFLGIQNVIVSVGMSKKDKIPVNKLPKWYEKFGFEKTKEYNKVCKKTGKKKKIMLYTPKKNK